MREMAISIRDPLLLKNIYIQIYSNSSVLYTFIFCFCYLIYFTLRPNPRKLQRERKKKSSARSYWLMPRPRRRSGSWRVYPKILMISNYTLRFRPFQALDLKGSSTPRFSSIIHGKKRRFAEEKREKRQILSTTSPCTRLAVSHRRRERWCRNTQYHTRDQQQSQHLNQILKQASNFAALLRPALLILLMIKGKH